jgi:uncharacterized tellurite resistance protein B-like protein
MSKSKSSITVALAKVLIAVAWADGAIQPEEISCLKDLLFHLPAITQEELLTLHPFIEKPVGKMERMLLIDNLLKLLVKKEEKDFVLYAIEKLMSADGSIIDKERAILESVKQSIGMNPTGFAKNLKLFMHKALSVRLTHINKWLKDSKLEAYLSTQINQLKQKKMLQDLSEKDLRKLFLAGKLISHISWIDERIKDQEVKCIIQYLQDAWDLTAAESISVARIFLAPPSSHIDIIRVVREYYEATTETERLYFLETLIKVGIADSPLSEVEAAEILELAVYFKVNQEEFQKVLSRSESKP